MSGRGLLPVVWLPPTPPPPPVTRSVGTPLADSDSCTTHEMWTSDVALGACREY